MPASNLHKNTSVSHLRYHFVFCPKRRRKVLVNAVADRLKVLLAEKCAELEWEIVALEVMPDHVHLFVGAEPDVAPSQVMHAFSTGQLGFKLRQEQEKGISKVRNTSQRAFLPTGSPGQDIPSHNSPR